MGVVLDNEDTGDCLGEGIRIDEYGNQVKRAVGGKGQRSTEANCTAANIPAASYNYHCQ